MSNALGEGFDRPEPTMVGKGMARTAAELAKLRRQRTEAAGRGDFDEVDRLTMEIQRYQAQAKAEKPR